VQSRLGTMICCPNCGHALATVDLPTNSAPPPSSEPGAPILLRVSEAARLLSISRSTMYQLTASGKVPVVRLGGTVRVPRRALEQLADQ
jgi:excisionase family DNA binding protein